MSKIYVVCDECIKKLQDQYNTNNESSHYGEVHTIESVQPGYCQVCKQIQNKRFHVYVTGTIQYRFNYMGHNVSQYIEGQREQYNTRCLVVNMFVDNHNFGSLDDKSPLQWVKSLIEELPSTPKEDLIIDSDISYVSHEYDIQYQFCNPKSLDSFVMMKFVEEGVWVRIPEYVSQRAFDYIDARGYTIQVVTQ